MKKYLLKTTFFTAVFFIANGCTTSTPTESFGGYYHSKIYFGKDLTVNKRQGIADGCNTAKGFYRKSHDLFQYKEYYDGWFIGRNRCRDLLKIDKNGNLEY
jgi:hypothetical protein